jgi:hypothetical protein
MKTFATCAVLAAATILLPLAADTSLAAKKKKSGSNVRDQLTSEQKAELRKLAKKWYKQKYGQVYYVEIKSDGSTICWVYQ